MKNFGLLLLILACSVANAAPASFGVHWTNINVSTPLGVTHYVDCTSSRFRLLPHAPADTELLATCTSSTITGSVGGPGSFGDIPFARVRINAPSLDRTDCYFVDQYMINPSVAMEIECGWTYAEFKNGFDTGR